MANTGILENCAAVRELVSAMATSEFATRMSANGYEIAGVLPIDAGYALVDDRRINGLTTAAVSSIVLCSNSRCSWLSTKVAFIQLQHAP